MQKEEKSSGMLSTNDALIRKMQVKLDDQRQALDLLESAYYKTLELSLPYNIMIQSLIHDHAQLCSEYRGLLEQHMTVGRFINDGVNVDDPHWISSASQSVTDEAANVLSMINGYVTILQSALATMEALYNQHIQLSDSFGEIDEYITIIQREQKIIIAQNRCLSLADGLIQRIGENMKSVCANCGNSYIEGDKYCRFCGAPMGTPIFIEETFACIYGPQPVKRIHTCEKCGFSWDTMQMIDKEQFCPKCGGSAPAIEQWM